MPTYIDPFMAEKPAYSPNPSGILQIDDKHGYEPVTILDTIHLALMDAGWSIVKVEASTAYGQIVAVMLPTAGAPDPPILTKAVLHPGDHCTYALRVNEMQVMVAEIEFVAFNPYLYETPAPCLGRVFYEMGGDYAGTMRNLVEAMNEYTPYDVTWYDTVDTGGALMSLRYRIKLETREGSYGNDDLSMSIGGSGASSKGFTTMQSPMDSEGNSLKIKLQTHYMSFNGLDPTETLGRQEALLVVSTSGGGYEITQPVYRGEYWMQVSKWQFCLWSKEDTGRTSIQFLASLPKTDYYIPGFDPVFVVSSENLSWLSYTYDYQRLTNAHHWEQSYGSGYGALIDAGWRMQEPSEVGERNPTMIYRSLRAGRSLLTVRGNAALTQPAYIMLSGNPNEQGPIYIAGRLWDMMISGTEAGDTDFESATVYDQKQWKRLSIPLGNADLTGTMWILESKGGAT